MSNGAQKQGINVDRELASQLQRLAVKFQSFDPIYIELKEQVDSITKALLVKVNALEAEKVELQKENAELKAKPKETPKTK